MEQLKNALHERDEQFKRYDKLIRKDSLLGTEKNGINTQELMDTLEISRTTLKERLGKLSEYGYVIPHKDGRIMYYQLNLDTLQAE